MAGSPENRWAEIERLFDSAMDLAPEERPGFLDQACPADPALRGEVERLLQAALRNQFLELPAAEYASPIIARVIDGSALRAGTHLGSYEIVREIARGGMATVYLARDLKHVRDVALKVLHPELAAALGAGRFLDEIRICAKLDHPHILTLIDSGETHGQLWYVLPYVRGETLRDCLTREHRLTREQAVGIVTEVAGALDYAHARGLVHRDIKPENILLHEGEAMLADFGIALAMREPGSPPSTGAAMSFGTPAYMSPEQATRGQEVDARSDVYSLAAVLYEMLAGEPLQKGPTAEATIAKVLTDPPARIRTLRPQVPEWIDDIVARGLARVAADRFESAGAFARALDAGRIRSVTRRRLRWIAGIVALAVLAGLLWSRFNEPPSGRVVGVSDRVQVTHTGNAAMPAISGDASRLAYITRHCAGSTCRYDLEVQDVIGGASHPVVKDAPGLYSIGWSPDRRLLSFVGSIGHQYGNYVVPVLGGPPQFLGAPGRGYIPATFFPRGDSLLVNGTTSIRVTTADGIRRDTIPSGRRAGEVLAGVWPVNGPAAMVTHTVSQGASTWRLVDNLGRELDAVRTPREFTLAQSQLARLTTSGVWLQLQTALVHLPLDARRGRFAGRADTAFVGLTLSFDVTADGGSIVFSEGTTRYDVWALSLDDALAGRFPLTARVSATSELYAAVAPDGGRMLLRRGSAGNGKEYVVSPVGDGREVTHPSSGQSYRAKWSPDGTWFWYLEPGETTHRVIRVDAGTGKPLSSFTITDSQLQDLDAVAGGGWIWIPQSLQRLRVQQPGDQIPRDLPRPMGVERYWSVLSEPDGRHVATAGWNVRGDSIHLHRTELATGRTTYWGTFFAEGFLGLTWLADGYLIGIEESKGTATLFRLWGPGRVERLGTIPRPVTGISISSNRTRVLVSTMDYRGDIWLARLRRSTP